MIPPPGWPEPMPARTDMATASAARTLSPLMVAAAEAGEETAVAGLAAEAGGDGPCWMTAAGEPSCSAAASRDVSSPPPAA